MSELTLCNFCTLKNLRRQLPPGAELHLRPARGKMGGVDVFVAPAGAEINLDPDGPHFKAWFWELSDSCAC